MRLLSVIWLHGKVSFVEMATVLQLLEQLQFYFVSVIGTTAVLFQITVIGTAAVATGIGPVIVESHSVNCPTIDMI